MLIWIINGKIGPRE